MDPCFPKNVLVVHSFVYILYAMNFIMNHCREHYNVENFATIFLRTIKKRKVTAAKFKMLQILGCAICSYF